MVEERAAVLLLLLRVVPDLFRPLMSKLDLAERCKGSVEEGARPCALSGLRRCKSEVEGGRFGGCIGGGIELVEASCWFRGCEADALRRPDKPRKGSLADEGIKERVAAGL